MSTHGPLTTVAGHLPLFQRAPLVIRSLSLSPTFRPPSPLTPREFLGLSPHTPPLGLAVYTSNPNHLYSYS